MNDGRVVTEGDWPLIRFERRLASPVSRVWRALTEPDELRIWLAESTVDLIAGGTFELRMHSHDEARRSLGRVTELEPERLLEFTWYPNELGDSRVRIELSATDEGCLLVLTHRFPDSYGAAETLGGWHVHLDALGMVCNGEQVELSQMPWARWLRHYLPAREPKMNDELGEIKTCYGVSFTRSSKHSPERLWRAITDSDEVTRWMAYPARVDLRVGGDYYADFSRTGGGELDGVIVKLEPSRLLRYAWGTSTVDWTIEPDGAGSRYVFAQHGLYPRDTPDEEGLAAGWHVWLDDLEQFLDTGAPPSDAEGEHRWRELGKLYRTKLAAVVGLE